MPNFLKVLRACELLNITQIQIRRAMIDPIVAPSPSPRRSTSESVRSARRSRMSHDVSHVPGPQATPVPAFKKENGASRRRKKLAAHTGATQTKSSQVKALTNAFEDLGMTAQDYGSSAASRSGPGSSNLTASSRRRRTNGAATNAVVGSNGCNALQFGSVRKRRFLRHSTMRLRIPNQICPRIGVKKGQIDWISSYA